MKVVIVGAGIAGLATAHALLQTEACESIRIYSAEAPQYTTTTVAGGLIEPAYVAASEDRIARWFLKSRQLFGGWMEEPHWHIRRAAVRILWRHAEPAPTWAALVDDFVVRAHDAAPYTHAWSFYTEVVEVPRHIEELLRRLAERGVTITHRQVSALDELKDEADLIINCSGAGARSLGDATVNPISGQVVILERAADLPDDVVIDEDPLTYVIPRKHDVVVGGTFVVGDSSRVPHIGVAEAMLRRAIRLVPQLERARVLAHRVGLRPSRPRPRLEIEATSELRGARIAHCYGMGGAGIGLAHGMASELATRVALIRFHPEKGNL